MSFIQNSLSEWTLPIKSGRHIHALHGYAREGELAATAFHFLHGNGFCAATLAGVAQQMPANSPLWLTDVPGHGGSEQPKHRMPDWPAMASSVAAALQQNNPSGQAVVGVGHSMGGVMTLLAAARYPSLFSRIILLDPVLFSPEIILMQKIVRTTGIWKRSSLVRAVSKRRQHWPDKQSMFADLQQKSLYRRWHPEVLQAFCDFGSKASGNERQLCCDPHWEGAIFGSYPRGLWHAVRHVNVPVDILVASDSYGFILGSAKKASAANSLIRWQTFNGTHCFPMEQPQQTANTILELLSTSVA